MRELDRVAVQRFVDWLTTRPGRDGRLCDRLIANALPALRRQEVAKNRRRGELEWRRWAARDEDKGRVLAVESARHVADGERASRHREL